jgi:hypothetical protein
MGEQLTLLESARELKTELEKLKIGDTLKAVKLENEIEKDIEIKLAKTHNLNYEIQKFFIYNWKKSKKAETNAKIFNNQTIFDPENKYEYIFRRYKDVDDLTFLFDFADVKQLL